MGSADQELITWSVNEHLDFDDDKTVVRPFEAVPVLEDCPLAELRSALSRPSEALTPSSRQTALWTKSRGGTELRGVHTTRIDVIYSDPDVSGTVFKALDLPLTLPLTQVQWQADNTLRRQQSMLRPLSDIQ